MPDDRRSLYGAGMSKKHGLAAALLAFGLLFVLSETAFTHHDDAEAAVFQEFLTRIEDETQSQYETVVIGHETEWDCEVRQLYFDLALWAEQYWPAPVAQTAAQVAAGIPQLHASYCDAAAEPVGPTVVAPEDR